MPPFWKGELAGTVLLCAKHLLSRCYFIWRQYSAQLIKKVNTVLRALSPKGSPMETGRRVLRETAMPPVFGKERAMGNKLRVMLGRSPPDLGAYVSEAIKNLEV